MRTALLVLLAGLPVRDAAACSIVVEPEFVPGPKTESVPPTAVTVDNLEVRVVDQTKPNGGCQRESTSCSDRSFAIISFSVSSTDDTTERYGLGYRLRVLREIGPTRLDAYDLATRAWPNGVITLYPKLGDDEELDLDLEIGVAAIDRSGNLGPESVVQIIHSDDSGCASGRNARPFGACALALGTLALLLRRRR